MINKPKTMQENAGFIIKSLRKSRGMTQKQLAEKIGKTSSAIAQYENGQAFPRPDALKAIADVFKVDPTLFMTPVPEDFIERLKEGGLEINLNEAFKSAGFSSEDTFEPRAELLYSDIKEKRKLEKFSSLLSQTVKKVENESSERILKLIFKTYTDLNLDGQIKLLECALDLKADSKYKKPQESIKRDGESIDENKHKE